MAIQENLRGPRNWNLFARSVKMQTLLVTEAEIDLKVASKMGVADTVYVKEIKELQDFLSKSIEAVCRLHFNLSTWSI